MKKLNKCYFRFIIGLFTFVVLSGCSKEKKEETFKTVSYYDTHKNKRDVRLEECQTMKEMTEIIMTDCANANTSYANESRGVPLNW